MSVRVSPPNYTQVPNLLLDRLADFTCESELKVVLVVVRHTFGWHKTRDVLSLSQLERKTGLSRNAVLKGVECALEHGWLEREAAGDSYSYALALELYDNTSAQSEPEVVQKVNPQKKELKKESPTPSAGVGEPVNITVKWPDGREEPVPPSLSPAVSEPELEEGPIDEPQYVEEGNEFGDGGPRARPKWQLPPDDPYLKRAMALSGALFFSTHDQRTAWKAIAQARTAGLVSDRWLEHCLAVTEARQRENKRRTPLKSILSYMGNFEKMRQWENIQADQSPSARPAGGKKVDLGMYKIDGPLQK